MNLLLFNVCKYEIKSQPLSELKSIIKIGVSKYGKTVSI